jgi:ABC-type nickel/cobalt efflux system permease component RcnA
MEAHILLATAFSIGFVHTIIGPDHYLPLALFAKANKWKKKKLYFSTVMSGFAHVIGTVILGFLGILIGISLNTIDFIQESRADFATWVLIAFGFFYFLYGIRHARKSKMHSHEHSHGDFKHTHEHNHFHDHSHMHTEKSNKSFWVLFLFFVLGPCEALIPILMYPAAEQNYLLVTSVVFVFGITTILTMLVAVHFAYKGINFINFKKIENHWHSIAGATIMLSGAAILFGL